MDDDERAELLRLQNQVDAARDSATRLVNEAIAERNAYMHRLYNGYRADPHELFDCVDVRSRTTLHRIIRGPRTGTYRAVSQTPKLARNHERREDAPS